jgi:AraC family transcriptional regulator
VVRTATPTSEKTPVAAHLGLTDVGKIPSETTQTRGPTMAAPDSAVVANLLSEALALLDQRQARARALIEQAIFLAHGQYHLDAPIKGMLADWQLRAAVRHIHCHLQSNLRIDEVAKVTKLSANYFSRAFKITTGLSYSEFVIRARINLAKHLLSSTETPISEIALMCGLSDQPHLTRLFRRSVGLPPSMWRRLVIDPPPARESVHPAAEDEATTEGDQKASAPLSTSITPATAGVNLQNSASIDKPRRAAAT